VYKTPSLIGRTREVVKGVAEVLDHTIVVGCVITGYAKYLQHAALVSDLLR
jgi:hypothetical protein